MNFFACHMKDFVKYHMVNPAKKQKIKTTYRIMNMIYIVNYWQRFIFTVVTFICLCVKV